MKYLKRGWLPTYFQTSEDFDQVNGPYNDGSRKNAQLTISESCGKFLKIQIWGIIYWIRISGGDTRKAIESWIFLNSIRWVWQCGSWIRGLNQSLSNVNMHKSHLWLLLNCRLIQQVPGGAWESSAFLTSSQSWFTVTDYITFQVTSSYTFLWF